MKVLDMHCDTIRVYRACGIIGDGRLLPQLKPVKESEQKGVRRYVKTETGAMLGIYDPGKYDG